MGEEEATVEQRLGMAEIGSPEGSVDGCPTHDTKTTQDTVEGRYCVLLTTLIDII